MIVREPLSPRLPWGIHLGTIVLGLLVLPIAPQRLEAMGSSVEVWPTLTADEPPQGGSGSEPQLRDLDRRLRSLETRMDRVLRALERRSSERATEEAAGDAEKKAKEVARAKEKVKEVKEKALTQSAQRKAPSFATAPLRNLAHFADFA